jgi:uncharacterized protein (TIGR03437 family)
VAVSSASGMPNVAPASLATAFGAGLAPQTESAAEPYPTTLGGISLQVVDSTGMVRTAPLLYVSPEQINFQIPAECGAGATTYRIVNGSGDGMSAGGRMQIVAPTLFTANGAGTGVVAATATRRVLPTNINSPVAVFTCPQGPGSCVSVPIDPGLDAPVTVTLYASGLEGPSSDSAVTLTIGGQPVPIESISQSNGIDLVKFGGLLALRGSGEVEVVLSVDGKSSNNAKIDIQ